MHCMFGTLSPSDVLQGDHTGHKENCCYVVDIIPVIKGTRKSFSITSHANITNLDHLDDNERSLTVSSKGLDFDGRPAFEMLMITSESSSWLSERQETYKVRSELNYTVNVLSIVSHIFTYHFLQFELFGGCFSWSSSSLLQLWIRFSQHLL